MLRYKRNSGNAHRDLVVPATRTVRFGPRSFAAAGLWTLFQSHSKTCNSPLCPSVIIWRLLFCRAHNIISAHLLLSWTVRMGEH